MFVVRGAFVACLRMGVHREAFGYVAQEIEALCYSEESDAEIMRQYQELMGRLNSARTLLDQIGWPGRVREGQSDVEVDLKRYWPLVLEGLLSELMSEPEAQARSAGIDNDSGEWILALRDLVLEVCERVGKLRYTPDWTAGFADIISYRAASGGRA
jgi:hypothetical protein